VFERVRADYVEKPDDSKLVESAINGMLAGLDPHSSYMDPKSFRDMQVQTRGEFGGLGIEVTMEDGLVKVVAPIDETPAAKAGVMANDIITKLDDEQVQGLTLNQAVDKMRGPVNTKIKLTIMRKGADKPIEVTIVRDVIRVKSVRSHAEGAKERFEREAAEHRAKLAAREAKTEATGKKPGGKPPEPPVEGPQPNDQINLTDEDSRIMPVAGGGYDQCYNAQAVVAVESHRRGDRRSTDQQKKRLVKRLADLGYAVEIKPLAA
jgi:hypothetical protein